MAAGLERTALSLQPGGLMSGNSAILPSAFFHPPISGPEPPQPRGPHEARADGPRARLIPGG